MVIYPEVLNLHPRITNSVMAVTRLKRKDRRNKARATNRIKRIKQLSRKPVIKNLEADEQPVEKVAAQETDKPKKATGKVIAGKTVSDEVVSEETVDEVVVEESANEEAANESDASQEEE